jgi:hypothetical protein
MSGSIPLLKKGAHLALSANEEVRIGASGSAGEGTRLESAESLERTFEGPGCGGRMAPLSLGLDSQRFRCSSVPLPSGLRDDTTGVSLRFSRCHELFIIIHDRGGGQAHYCVGGSLVPRQSRQAASFWSPRG